jgi:Domain of unknown function (DUF4062)
LRATTPTGGPAVPRDGLARLALDIVGPPERKGSDVVEGALGVPPPRLVFLAHTTDLRPFLHAARDAVKRALYKPIDMENDLPDSPASPVEQCREFVELCDVFVVIVGSRYGSSTMEEEERSFVQMELDEATRFGKPRLVFLLDEPPHDPRQARFRERLRSGATTVGLVKSPDDLRVHLIHALAELQRPAACGIPELGHGR